jgi:serine/threonine protein phosphatase PrpC
MAGANDDDNKDKRRMHFLSQAATHRGMVRELNEDALFSCGDEGTWAVADGMGGHEGGDRASGLIVRTLETMRLANSFKDSLGRLQDLIQRANQDLVNSTASRPRHLRPGSTIVSLLLQDGKGAAVWAGDSRLYRLRDGVLEQLTRDHSQVQALVDQGLVDEDHAESHPMAHVITQAIGFDVPAGLETRRFEVRPGDRFLLCSDGLIRVVGKEEILEHLSTTPLPERASTLIDLSLERGAPDNVTVVCVDCEP